MGYSVSLEEKGRREERVRGDDDPRGPALSVHKWSKCIRYTCCLVSATCRLWAMGRRYAIEELFCPSIGTY